MSTDGLDAAIEAAWEAWRRSNAPTSKLDLDLAVRAAYPHIRRAVLNEAADAYVADPYVWNLSSEETAQWLRERAEEGGDG